MADLPRLIEEFQRAGMDVTTTIVAEPPALAEAQDLSAYRIV